MLEQYFIIRDKRLEGRLPSVADPITSTVDAGISLANAFGKITGNMMHYGKLKSLFILGHGFGDGWGTTNDFWWRGGKGVQLGLEGLTAANVQQWATISGMFDSIVVYACGAAYSGPPSPAAKSQTPADGLGLMKELAKHTKATVYAADKIQWYFPKDFNLGRWEGNVYLIAPSGFYFQVQGPPNDVYRLIQDEAALNRIPAGL